MSHFNFDDEREALDRRSREIHGQLRALLAQKDTLERTIFSRRHNALLGELHEIEHRLADINVDEQSLHRMEGGE